MTNPRRSIDTNLFHSRARAPHAILRPLLLAAATTIATAQMSTESSSSSDLAYTNIHPSVTIIIAILVLLFFFFFMCFLSLYIRFCTNESENTRRTTAAPPQQTKPGLYPEVIESFPIFQYSEVKALRIGKGGALECAVCLAEFEDDDTLRLLPKCDHVFHPECIDAWLASHSSCPICRANLTPSQNELAEGLESTHLNNSEGLVEAQNQIQIDIDERPTEEVQVSEMPKRNQRGGGKFSRSHSTGHSLIQPGENLERYTLRLPTEVMRQMMSQRLKRTISCVVVLPREGSSRRGEGSSAWRHVGRSDREGRSDRWVFSMTPPFLSRVRLPTPPKLVFERDSTALGGSKSFLTTVKTPSDCVAVKIDGVEQTSTCPPV